jgi:hypothetical protein
MGLIKSTPTKFATSKFPALSQIIHSIPFAFQFLRNPSQTANNRNRIKPQPSNPEMNSTDKEHLLKQILWDYNIKTEDIESVLTGKMELAGHYTREMIFLKMLESYSWFTILQLLTPFDIRSLLTSNLIKKLRSPSLRKKYEFVQHRLHEIIATTG